MKKGNIAFILNAIILIGEIIGFGYTLWTNHSIAIEYYTNDSNLLALVSSALFLIFYKSDKEWVRTLRHATTCCLTLTLLVVVFILGPMYHFDYKMLMFTSTFFVFHTLCPILSIISYVFYEKKSKNESLGFILTLVYAVILIGCNIAGTVDGPYPFLKIREQSLYVTVLWGVLILGGSYFVGRLLNLNGKKQKER